MAKRYRHPNIKEIIEGLLTTIAKRHKVKRPENFLSEEFDIEVYGVRQWTVRGIPMDKRDRFAELLGITRRELDAMHGQ